MRFNLVSIGVRYRKFLSAENKFGKRGNLMSKIPLGGFKVKEKRKIQFF